MIKNIIFDFGGVLVDWNPHYLFDKYLMTLINRTISLKMYAIANGMPRWTAASLSNRQ